MSNQWGIPPWLENEIRERDKVCVYCGVQMSEKSPPGGSRRTVATWEHIINDASIITRENIVLCCCGCNASKGQKPLAVWLQSRYCREREITPDSVAPIIKQAFENA